ncbi:MAG: iron-sulfur cluster assembly accessory protein [Alphaproteobacteria bacterium CG_4_9_14_3_um_filter_47_13]|nr:MAG: iron-sulfur cluster assembly accessory protein [Alphaproteobacteria bacterium CG_4_9_14_3_um_filter_47_13]
MAELITITDRAAEELKKRTAMNADAIGVRLSVTNTGCSGHKYKMEHVFEESPADDGFEHAGAKLYIPKMSTLFLVGMEIDYKDDNLASTFIFKNPNAESTCGCGESFKVKGESA